MGTADIIALTEKYQMPNYARLPVVFVRGEGARLFDAEGREYLDFLGGIAVTSLGHAHPEVTRAVTVQAGNLLHVSNLFHVPVQSEAARLLSETTIGGKVFFCNSGTEAVEAAIKLSRKWFADRGREAAHEFVVLEGSFHGRTYGGLSATAQPRFHKGFEPMLPGFVTVPFGDIAALESALTDRTCAFLVEPIQGESGVRMHPPGYLKEAERLCRQKGVLLVLDEIQTGMGRTGAMLAGERFGLLPDIVTLAKGIANGLPLGAVVAREEIAAAFGPGSHGSTFGGNPVCCAAAKVVLETLASPGFLGEVDRKGEILKRGLSELAARRTDVRKVRGLGLMMAWEMEVETKEIALQCLRNGLVVNATSGNVLRFLPPLTVTEPEIRHALDLLWASLPERGRK
ncbi:MAG TPA: aspartate aminotransferase family protein [Candidatus Deferrimicrobiaceae bacterium]|nr:aspartate aminotransferase family protein [Candidatus Deferrimicrobiaceae bacterium]